MTRRVGTACAPRLVIHVQLIEGGRSRTALEGASQGRPSGGTLQWQGRSHLGWSELLEDPAVRTGSIMIDS